MSEQKKLPRILKYSILLLIVIIISFFSYTIIRGVQFAKITEAPALEQQEKDSLKNYLATSFDDRAKTLRPLSYECYTDEPEVYAESAVLIDVLTGDILYQKNADMVIPPASMTKLFAMYVVEQEVSAGRFSYTDLIPLPPQSWACNMPPHSSLMFLGEGQRVTLEELLLGLSICSGNDAAYALAYAVSGSMEAFIDKMNQVAEQNGLTHTHFVESSGYSEKNTTTAKEMALFSRIYLNEHPQSLKRFHSVPDFTYPKEKNMSPGDRYEPQDFSNGLPRHITMGITQKNTNPLLGLLPGCDGLKTGYIDESGYNLALTASREGTRFLSVTMRGPGKNTREGQAGRIHDGTNLMEFAFACYKDFTELSDVHPYFAKVYGSNQKALNLVPAFSLDGVCIPVSAEKGKSAEEILSLVTVEVNLPKRLKGNITQGEILGSISIKMNGAELENVPLVADRTAVKADWITNLADCFIR